MPHVAAAAQQAISASLLTWPARKANIGSSVTSSAASHPASAPAGGEAGPPDEEHGADRDRRRQQPRQPLRPELAVGLAGVEEQPRLGQAHGVAVRPPG